MKYGLPDSESHFIVERHFAVMLERQCMEAAVFDHSLRTAPIGHALLAKGEPAVTVPVALPVAAPPAPSAPPVVNQRAKFDELRQRLGLQ